MGFVVFPILALISAIIGLILLVAFGSIIFALASIVVSIIISCWPVLLVAAGVFLIYRFMPK